MSHADAISFKRRPPPGDLYNFPMPEVLSNPSVPRVRTSFRLTYDELPRITGGRPIEAAAEAAS